MTLPTYASARSIKLVLSSSSLQNVNLTELQKALPVIVISISYRIGVGTSRGKEKNPRSFQNCIHKSSQADLFLDPIFLMSISTFPKIQTGPGPHTTDRYPYGTPSSRRRGLPQNWSLSSLPAIIVMLSIFGQHCSHFIQRESRTR